MFKITFQNPELGRVIVEDENFGLLFEFTETNFINVKVQDDYDLIFEQIDGSTKKINILPR